MKVKSPVIRHHEQQRWWCFSTTISPIRCFFTTLSTLVAVQMLVLWHDASVSDVFPNIPFQQQHQQQEVSSSTSLLSLAIIVAGSTKRFLFNSTVHHVMKPKPKASGTTVVMDYYVWLTMNAGPGFRQSTTSITSSDSIQGDTTPRKGNYMNYLAYDPVLRPVFESSHRLEHVKTNLQKVMADTIHQVTATSSMSPSKKANLRMVQLLENPLEDGPIVEELRQKVQNDDNNKDESSSSSSSSLYDSFPMIDHRPQAKDRTRIGNHNMVRLFLAIESLWDGYVVKTELETNRRYDYILILRDDTYWISDFDLQRVINTNPAADAFVLSCNARQPGMLPPEINDHGILIKRSKADVVGKYLSSMVHADLNECHRSVRSFVGAERGCNSEMILKYILHKNNVTVQLVPQSVLPFERSVIVNHNPDNGESNNNKNNGDNSYEYCLHKFCQSIEQPLAIPADLRQCKDITI